MCVISITRSTWAEIGRDDWIRTSDLVVPNDARYQTAPHPVFCGLNRALLCANFSSGQGKIFLHGAMRAENSHGGLLNAPESIRGKEQLRVERW